MPPPTGACVSHGWAMLCTVIQSIRSGAVGHTAHFRKAPVRSVSSHRCARWSLGSAKLKPCAPSITAWPTINTSGVAHDRILWEQSTLEQYHQPQRTRLLIRSDPRQDRRGAASSPVDEEIFAEMTRPVVETPTPRRNVVSDFHYSNPNSPIIPVGVKLLDTLITQLARFGPWALRAKMDKRSTLPRINKLRTG